MNRRPRINRASLEAILIIAIGFLFSSTTWAQESVQTAAPAEWKKYRMTSQDVSAEFPKFPTADQVMSPCDQLQINHYFAYADQAVYRLSVYSKLKGFNAYGCTRVSRFGDKTFGVRLKQFFDGRTTTKADVKIGDSTFTSYELSLDKSRYRIIDNIKNGKWVELSVTYRAPDPTAINRFFNSLAFTDYQAAIDVNNGSSNTLGDESEPDETSEKIIDTVEESNYLLVYKPKAKYTEAARKSGVRGTVRLKVGLLHNGGIGTITVVSGPKNGLTEQAINAARRLVFLPKIADGKPVSVSVTVDYSFILF